MDFFLFLTRPTIWVYNRLIVMFLTFYAFYYVFGIGVLCTSQCKVKEVSDLRTIGVMFFTLPFHNPAYLFQWRKFDLSTYDTSKEAVFAIIQQVLIFTTIFDLLMDIWSVSQIFKRVELTHLAGTIQAATMRGFKGNKKIGTQVRNSKPKTSMPPINEETEMAAINNNNVYHHHDNNNNGMSSDDYTDELNALSKENIKYVDQQQDQQEEEEFVDQEEEEKQQLKTAIKDEEVMDAKHKVVDTVDDILANYAKDINLDGIEDETSESEDPSNSNNEEEPGNDETPGYNKLSSESIQSRSKHKKQDSKYKIAKPSLATIQSENNS